jgi:hypothetical protein
MADNTFYFSHDYNTRLDDKIKDLIYQHGYLGYGLYWALVEDLYNNANALRRNYKRIADDYKTQVETIESIIEDFDLFVLSECQFHSNSVEKRLNQRESKSVKARESAQKRWNNANALQTQSDGNAIKERKGKKIKEKEIIISVELPFNTMEFFNKWNEWKLYKKEQHKFSFKTGSTEKSALNNLVNLSSNDVQIAIEIINQSISNGWKGFFEIKNKTNATKPINETRFDKRIEYANRWNNADIEIKENF